MGRILLAALFVWSLPLRAFAADQTVLGKQLMVKNTSTPDKRKILLQAQEPSTDNTIVGDPTVHGATLTVNVYGGASSAQTYNLPAGMNASGKPFWSGDAT